MDRFKSPSEAIDICNFLDPIKATETVQDIPNLYFCFGINPAVDGSAYLEYKAIKVVCSVLGPTEMKQDGQLTASFKFAPFACQVRRDSMRDSEEKQFSKLLLSALEPAIALHTYPRGKYQISVVILDDGTSTANQSASDCLSAGITCATLALIHSGVQMYDLVLGLNARSNVVAPGASIAVAIMPQLRQVTMVNANSLSAMSSASFKSILDDLMDKAVFLHSNLRSRIFSSLEHELSEVPTV